MNDWYHGETEKETSCDLIPFPPTASLIGDQLTPTRAVSDCVRSNYY